MVAAALEVRTPKDAWREAASHYKPAPGPAECLAFLTANGYLLSAIEQVSSVSATPTRCTRSRHTECDAGVDPPGPAPVRRIRPVHICWDRPQMAETDIRAVPDAGS
jgi:hypothetical protein